MQLIFANNAKTTLAGPISAGATSAILAAGTGALFPNPAANQYFVITFVPAGSTVAGEIAWCTARSGDTLTLVRAKEGTAGTAYAAGDTVTLNPTAGSLRAPLQIPIYNGNPNGFLAGQAGSATESPDSVYQPPSGGGGTGIIWVCTTGNTNPAVAVWTGLGEAVGSLLQGQCYASVVSATQIKLAPYGGNGIVSGGVQYYLPSGGITAANTGVTVNGTPSQNLAASTAYLVSYNGLANILKFWRLGGTYSHAPDTTTGNIGTEVITNSGTPITDETLVMLISTTSGAQFADSGANRLLASWFNPQSKTGLGEFSATRTVTGDVYQEINEEIRVQFVTFANRNVNFIACGEVATSNSALDGIHTALNIDGVIQNEQCATFCYNNFYGAAMGIVALKSVSEGGHYASLFGGSTGGFTGSWFSEYPGSPTVPNGTLLEVSIAG